MVYSPSNVKKHSKAIEINFYVAKCLNMWENSYNYIYMGGMVMDKIIERILKETGINDINNRLNKLPMSDFNSLMLGLYGERVEKTTPAELLKSFGENRFVAPAAIDPIKYCQLELNMLSFSKQMGIEPVILSPAAPLGSASVFGAVDQNNVVSATRGVEILPDATNMLALILSDRIKKGEDNSSPIHMSSCNRLIRAQALPGPGYFAHFGIFGIVSSGKDKGSYMCESELLSKHISFYREFFKNSYGASLSITLRRRGGYKDGEGFFTKMLNIIKENLPGIPVESDEGDLNNNYYRGINFKIYVNFNGDKFEIGDGGFTDWTQKLLNNKKERCLISGIGMDRLLLV